jgi:hypothetical protein
MNNVCFIKTNNLQIDDIFIEKDYIQHVENVFNYTAKNIIAKTQVNNQVLIKFENVLADQNTQINFDSENSAIHKIDQYQDKDSSSNILKRFWSMNSSQNLSNFQKENETNLHISSDEVIKYSLEKLKVVFLFKK